MGSSGIVLSSGPHRLLRGRWEGQRHRDSKHQAAESGEWGSQRIQNLPIPRLWEEADLLPQGCLCPNAVSCHHPTLSPLRTPQSQSELFPVPARICHEPHVGTLERIDLQYLPWITTRSKVQGPSGADSLSPAAPSRVWGAPPSLPSAVSLGASWKGYPGCPLQRGRGHGTCHGCSRLSTWNEQ